MLAAKAKRTGGTNSNAFKSKTLYLQSRRAFSIQYNENLLNVQLATAQHDLNFICNECSRPLALYCENGIIPNNGVRYLCDKCSLENGGLLS